MGNFEMLCNNKYYMSPVSKITMVYQYKRINSKVLTADENYIR